MYRSFDASRPPATGAPGCVAVLGYLGGQTPHAWSLPEWQRFGHLRQAPIWVYWPGRNPENDAVMAIDRMRSLGWTPDATPRRFCVADMETAVDVEWLETFYRVLNGGGYDGVTYGSSGFVHGNPGGIGYWVAKWDGITDLPAGTIAHQFDSGQPWQNTRVDYSVWEQPMLERFGWGPRG